MNKRPPFLGYNHNVRHKGRLFHVQTEDSGLSRPVLTTHVFVDGTILGTMRGQYTVDEADPVVQKRMQDQHKTMLKRVRDGQFDEAAAALPEAASSAKPEAKTEAKVDPTPVKVEAVKVEPAKAVKRIDAVPEHIPHEVAPETQRLAVARKPPPPPPPPSRKEGKDGKDPHSSSGSWSVATALDKHPLSGESTAELQPVLKASEPSPLAARLKIGTPQVVPPLLAAQGVASQNSAAYAALQDEDIEPVVEMEVGSSDDDEPQLTIEAAEPTEEEAQAEELSKATPLPAAMPLGHDETFMMGADQLVPPPRVGPFTVSVPLGQHVRPMRPTRPIAIRPLHSGALRARPTSEGVTLLCMAPTLAKVRARKPPKNPVDPLRTTQPHLRSTTPAPQSSAASAVAAFQPSEGSQPIDDKIMAFLRREAAR